MITLISLLVILLALAIVWAIYFRDLNDQLQDKLDKLEAELEQLKNNTK